MSAVVTDQEQLRGVTVVDRHGDPIGKLSVERASRLALHYGWTLDEERTHGEPADG